MTADQQGSSHCPSGSATFSARREGRREAVTCYNEEELQADLGQTLHVSANAFYSGPGSVAGDALKPGHKPPASGTGRNETAFLLDPDSLPEREGGEGAGKPQPSTAFCPRRMLIRLLTDPGAPAGCWRFESRVAPSGAQGGLPARAGVGFSQWPRGQPGGGG